MKTKTLTLGVIILAIAVFVILNFFSKPSVELVDNTNVIQNGDIGESSTTTAIFSGFYSEKNYSVSVNEQLKCPAVLVQKSNDPLFLYFSKLVQDGNTVNSVDQDGNLLLNINLDEVAIESKTKILSSNKENPVNINVQKLGFGGKGANPCTSFVRILSIE